jgi:hypothetical protein
MEQRNRREGLADPVGTYVGLLDNAGTRAFQVQPRCPNKSPEQSWG